MNTPPTPHIDYVLRQVSWLEAVVASLSSEEGRDAHPLAQPGNVFVELEKLRAWLSAQAVPVMRPITIYNDALLVDETDAPQSQEEYLAVWQHLVDTGRAWQLQGLVTPLACELIEAGLIRPPSKPNGSDTETEE